MKNVFEITENILPLHGFKSENSQDYLSLIELDISNLMRRLAEAEFSHSKQEEQHTTKTRHLLLNLLEIMDAFERLFGIIETRKDQVTDQSKKWIANFRTVYRILKRTLSQQGVVPIENLNQGFDPHWHNAVDKVNDPSKPEGTIIEERKKGYVWQNQILREAEVVIVRNPTGNEKPPPDPLTE